MSSPIQDSDGGIMKMSDSDILNQCRTFILSELGRLDDISEEFANTMANVYHRFVKLRYSARPSFDSLQKACEYPAELAKILSDYEAAKKMVAHLRRPKMEADPTVADAAEDLYISSLKYNVKYGENKSLFQMKAERLLHWHKVNEIKGLAQKLDLR
jgi:hypothetical protein